MKKIVGSIFITVWVLLTNIASAANQDGVVKFVITAPSGASINEAVDITVQAVDINGAIVPSYRGSVIFNTDNVGDIMPAPGKTIQFTADDNGEKKFPKGVTFKKTGQQKIFVNDVSDDIAGQATITISAGALVQTGTTQDISIITPSNGSTVISDTIMISGKTQKNSKVSINLNGQDIGSIISDDTGIFTSNLTNITQESNIIKANLMNDAGSIIASSLETRFTRSGGMTSTYATSTGTTNTISSQIVTDEISAINSSITETLKSAPLSSSDTQIVYSSWELMQRTPMLAGFTWIGEIAKFITPQMLIGTPFGSNATYIGQLNPNAAELQKEPNTYAECITNESYLSYGLGERIKKTDLEEFRSIAKVCAEEFYGKYFKGKSYTTREEFLMMMFTLFGEEVTFDGQFTDAGKYIEKGTGTDSGFKNINPKSWYAPYLGLANDIEIFVDSGTNWKVGQAISNTEMVEYLLLYTAHRMDFQGDSLERGSIATEKLKFNITFINTKELTIRIQ